MKLLFFLLLLWVLVKAVGMIFRSSLGGSMDSRANRFGDSQPGRGTRQGNVNVDHNPNNSDKGYKGGEYVDYEELD